MPDVLEFEYDVFISYSSQDKQWVHDDLLPRIERSGLRAFIDFRDFKPGAPSIKEMERGITICRKTLVVLTPAYIASEWCEIESIMLQTLSPANRNLRLIPLLKTPCEKPVRIGALTYIDFTEGADVSLSWQKLLSALKEKAHPSEEEQIPAVVKAELDKAKSLMEVNKHVEAIPILENALALADHANHPIAGATVRLNLAHALLDARDDFRGAEQVYRDALSLVPVTNHDLRHRILHGLGETLLFAGCIDEAKAVASTLDDITKRAGKKEELAWSLMLQSHLEQELGFHTKSFTMLDEAIRLFLELSLSLAGEDQLQNASALAVCYLNKAALCKEEGRFNEALALCQKAEEQHRISGDKLDAGKALLFCGEIHCENADWEKGYHCFRQATELFLEIANPLWLARAVERISRLNATHERWKEALEGMLAAAAGAAESGHAGEQVHFLCEAASLLRKWKTQTGHDNILRQIEKLARNVPEEEQASF